MKKLFTFLMLLTAVSFAWSQDHTVEVSSNMFTPADLTVFKGQTVEWTNLGGNHNVNGKQSTFSGNPASFENGAPSTAAWTFQHTFDTIGFYNYQCDPHAGFGMVGTVTVLNTLYPIGLVTADSDNDQNADSLNVECSLTGVVYGVDLNGGDIVQFTIIGSDGEGIAVRGDNYGYTVLEGDEITVEGVVDEFARLAQFVPDTIILNSAGNTLVSPMIVTALDETTESQLITLENMHIVDTTGTIGGYNIRITDGSMDTFLMRIDNGVDLHDSGFPTGTFNVTGLGGQFNDDYQILPRYTADIEEVVMTTADMLITGVYDAQPASLGARGFEVYVINDIPDMSIYGFGSANNGGGTDSVEWNFPVMAANAGDCFSIAADSMLFNDFFGMSADFVTGFATINGDDAVELFKDGEVIDLYGVIDVNGDNEVWDYTDGWAYRKSGTGPDGSTFQSDNWVYGGVDALQGGATNSAAPSPYPNCSYSPVAPTDISAADDSAVLGTTVAANIDILANDQIPNGVTSISIVTMPSQGMAAANGTVDITYTPTAGACGTDSFTYEICDANMCSQATVTVTFYCAYDIGAVTGDDDGDFSVDSLGVLVDISGVVYGLDYWSGSGYSFTLIGADGNGINVFEFNDVSGYTVSEGDNITVWGTIDEFRGLVEIRPEVIVLNSQGNTLDAPTPVTTLGEDTESQFIKLENYMLVDPTQWDGSGGSFNVDITDGTNTHVMRISDQSEVLLSPAPAGLFNVTGLGAQRDLSDPLDGDYQIFPRYNTDIEEIIATNDLDLGNKIKFNPNPVSDVLQIRTEIQLDQIRVTNMLGQQVKNIDAPQLNETLNVNAWQTGVYVITFISEDRIFTSQFVKQ